MARKKKKHHHEEHISEVWLIPYADILTLLLALFIVLYASSQVDQKKFQQIAQSFSMAFNSGQPALLQKVNLISRMYRWMLGNQIRLIYKKQRN